jgi:hypothetical protein
MARTLRGASPGKNVHKRKTPEDFFQAFLALSVV